MNSPLKENIEILLLLLKLSWSERLPIYYNRTAQLSVLGGVLIIKTRYIYILVGLPAILWLEVFRVIIYLFN